jgi:dephospho-CoA kinase
MSKSNQLPESFPSISIVGVCGSIGSGKSFACSLMTSKLNEKPSSYVTPEITAHHIDTDSLAHGVYAPGSKAISEIGDEFGQGVIANGTVDRKALGAIVFSNGTKMAVSSVCDLNYRMGISAIYICFKP